MHGAFVRLLDYKTIIVSTKRNIFFSLIYHDAFSKTCKYCTYKKIYIKF